MPNDNKALTEVVSKLTAQMHRIRREHATVRNFADVHNVPAPEREAYLVGYEAALRYALKYLHPLVPRQEQTTVTSTKGGHQP